MPAFRFRLSAAAALALTLVACGMGLGRRYEYDEQLYLRADGSAAVVINASIPALMALHGLPLDPAPRARIDRDAIRTMVTEPGLEIGRVSRPWRRDGRQFIQIRAEIEDVRKLGATKLFRGAEYSLIDAVIEDQAMRIYRQRVGPPAGGAVPNAGWDGTELAAFKLHLPSRIDEHNVRRLDNGGPGDVERGNILTWEQRLSDRLKGQPIDMQVTIESGSILYRTLSIFALSFAAAMILLGGIAWRFVRRGRRRNAART
jgi:hypothetical protein